VYWSGSCYVKRVGTDNICVQSAHNISIEYLTLSDWPLKMWAGNGPCGRVTDKRLSPSAGLGTGQVVL
jgi:hypothetical protein